MLHFTFKEEYYKAAESLPDDLRGQALAAVCRYGLYAELPSDPVALAVVLAVRPGIDAGRETSRRRAEAGRAGGLAKASKPKQNLAKSSKSKQTVAKASKISDPHIDNYSNSDIPKNIDNLKEGDNHIDIDIYIDKEKEKVLSPTEIIKKTEKNSTFSRPKRDDVAAYIREKGLDVDADQFIDHYNSNGWKVGKNSMKDWRAAVRNWARMDAERKKQQAPKPGNRFHNFDGRGTDYDAIIGL